MKIILAVAAGLSAALAVGSSSVGLAAGSDMRLPVNGFLCNTADQAVQFADVLAAGEMEEIAQDRVGRAAGAEVCGHFSGTAAITAEQVQLRDGVAYKLTEFRFDADHREAWIAERSFAPVSAAQNDI